MKAVMLVAGRSTRTWPLTLTKPKPLLKVAGKTILQHNLEQLNGLIEQLILVVGYKKEQIEELVKRLPVSFKIRFVEQKEQLGTGNALAQVEQFIKGRFLVLAGDDIYSKRDIAECLKRKYAILTKEVENGQKFGICVVKGQKLVKIFEKPKKPPSNLANTGCYVLDEEIFPIIAKIKKSVRGEYELTDSITEFAKKHSVEIVKAKNWYAITYPWDLLVANKALLENAKEKILGKIERGVTVKGKLILGKGSLIRSGTYIEGPVLIGQNCVIGPNSFLRPYTSIGNGCRVGNAVEIKNSIIGDNSFVSHLSYVGDSILGDGINCGAGTIIANLRHDGKNIHTMVGGKLIDTGLRKFGTVIGDGAKIGIHTSILPGRKIWPGRTTYPGEIVKKDII
jgi:bifunctional UDP-N-acetylglucosamine pyrophosphorylase/glucosamine-1-phosphate N-acetyltransferase